MESTIVIKVKYGETLRRFNGLVVSETFKVGFDMKELRAKICSLFNFPSNADLIMTCIDEDGDVVTLVDDDDLYYLIQQRLKVFRIDVKLSGEMSKHPCSDSPAQPFCPDFIHPTLGGYTLRWRVPCDCCGADLTPGLVFQSTAKKNLALCRTCCTEIGNEIDYMRPTYECGFRRRCPSPRSVYIETPLVEPPACRAYGPKPGQAEQKSCSKRDDRLGESSFMASRVDNEDYGSVIEANIRELLRDDQFPSFRRPDENFPSTLAALSSTECHPVLGHIKLPSASVFGHSFFIEVQEKRLRQLENIRQVLTNEFYSRFPVDSLDIKSWPAALDQLEKMGFGDRATVERVLTKNEGYMRTAVAELIAREKA